MVRLPLPSPPPRVIATCLYGACLLACLAWLTSLALSATQETSLARARTDEEDLAWRSKDEEERFGSVRERRYEDPEGELMGGAGAAAAREEASDGEGGSPDVMRDVEAGGTEGDPVVRLCGAGASARPMRPGARNSKMPVQYVHIPKAGGMSVQHALQSWAKVAGLRYFRHDGSTVEGSSATCPGAVGNHDVFAGHRGLGFCEFPRGENMFIFTVFREPVSRMVSQYDYNLKSRGTIRARANFGTSRSLSQWVVHFNRTPEVEHGEFLLKYSGSQQARFVCGYECMGPAGKAKTDDIILKRAMDNMKRLRAVGVLEDFNAILDQLKLHLRWVPRNAGWPHANVGNPSAKSELDARAREIMTEWARIDRTVYAEALRMAEQMNRQAKECLSKVDIWKQEEKEKKSAGR